MSPDVTLRSARGRGVMLATIVGSGVAFLDQTVVNVALATFRTALDADLSQLQWIVDAYLLFLGALLLVGGSLGDRHGRRRVFVIGLIWFAVASALCGLAPDANLLIAARALQGIGAALLVPVSLALVRASFRKEDQGAAIGAWAGLSGVTTALGPMLGGWLIDVASWRYIFFINLPLAAIGVWSALRCVPESRDESAPPSTDFPGAVLATLGLGGLVYALIEGPRAGWGAASLTAAVIGVAAFMGFILVERRQAHPMLPLDIFRSLQFTGANLATLAVYFALGGAFFFVVLQLQTVLGYSALEAGAALTPITVLMFLLSPTAGKIGAKVGFRGPMTIGPLIAAVGIGLLTRAVAGASYVSGVLPGLGVFGLGLSLTVAPLTTAVFEGAPPHQAGIASGVNNAVARIAGLLAVALLPWAAGIPEEATDEAFSAGYVRAMWLCSGLTVLGALCSFLTVERKPPPGRVAGRQAERPTERSTERLTEGIRRAGGSVG